MRAPVTTSATRQVAAGSAGALARALLAPFAALAAAAAAIVFVLLLPLCGIASIAEAIAKISWRFVRAAWVRGTMSRA